MVGVDWVLVAIIAAGVVAVVIVVALIARAVGGGKKKAPPAKTTAKSTARTDAPKKAAPAPAAAPVVPAPPAAPVGAASALGNEIVVTMTCDPLKEGGKGITREIKLAGGNGVYSWTVGTRESERYEHWEMKIDGGSAFTVTGEYIEGSSALQPISLAGTINGGVVSGEGMRGPRKATIHS
jgi:hypothetical protein